jgi:hypothetical protein
MAGVPAHIRTQNLSSMCRALRLDQPVRRYVTGLEMYALFGLNVSKTVRRTEEVHWT